MFYFFANIGKLFVKFCVNKSEKIGFKNSGKIFLKSKKNFKNGAYNE